MFAELVPLRPHCLQKQNSKGHSRKPSITCSLSKGYSDPSTGSYKIADMGELLDSFFCLFLEETFRRQLPGQAPVRAPCQPSADVFFSTQILALDSGLSLGGLVGPKPALGCFWTEVTQRCSAQHGECTCPAMITR